jgi:hypothetical protein
LKKRLLLAPLLIGLLSSCSSIKTVNFKPFTEVVATNYNQNKNYVKANEFLVEKFNSSKSIIQFSDKEAGIVKGKYIMTGGEAIITIKVKDSLSKITIDTGDLFYTRSSKDDDANAYSRFKSQINGMAKSFIIYMKNNNDDDW